MKSLILIFALTLPAHAAIQFQPGEQVFYTGVVPTKIMTLLSRQGDGRFLARHETGRYAGLLANDQDAWFFARMSGCLNSRICVGRRYIVPSRHSAIAAIAGYRSDGELVLTFITGQYAGQSGSGYQLKDLVPYAE